MSEVKHSLGPWQVGTSNNSPAVRDAKNQLVAVVSCQRTGEERAANAQLIVAAPELFAALCNIVNTSNEFSEPIHYQVRAAIHAAYPAIHKATQETS